ncbi:hypothetical protein [Nocardia terpenica]|uniref:hypothetical protein n=1 Tax=Nocardia terpenica TaxID=455432 RepID=UPI001E5C691A|nr:hypothetical protein [Nocardia terpenica]
MSDGAGGRSGREWVRGEPVGRRTAPEDTATDETPGDSGGEARTDAAGHDEAAHGDNFAEFAEELRLLAETILERVEPVLRQASADGRTEWDSCSWCPVCAAAALVRGQHHDVVAALAEHGTAIVTVLREALAGVPVEPIFPPDDTSDSRNAGDAPGTKHGTMGRMSATTQPRRDGGKSRYVPIPVQIKA